MFFFFKKKNFKKLKKKNNRRRPPKRKRAGTLNIYIFLNGLKEDGQLGLLSAGGSVTRNPQSADEKNVLEN